MAAHVVDGLTRKHGNLGVNSGAAIIVDGRLIKQIVQSAEQLFKETGSRVTPFVL
jgi:hypothetical protein